MFPRSHDFFHALNLANKAMRRGNVADAERWIRCAERHLRIAERFETLLERQAAKRHPPEAPDRQPLCLSGAKSPRLCNDRATRAQHGGARPEENRRDRCNAKPSC